LIAILLATALLVAGCGGSGSDPSSDTTAAAGTAGALSKTELIEQADAICAKANAVAGGIEPGGTGSAVRLAALYRGMVKSLKKLGNPDETEGRYGEYLFWAKNLAEVEGEVERAAAQGDTARIEELGEAAESTLSSFAGKASEYGLKGCGTAPRTLRASAG
jgi:hypothetical protein